MWKAICSLTSRGADHSAVATSALASEPTAGETDPKDPEICHFLRLPIEIRSQIYAYTEIGVSHTIEVLNVPIIQTSQGMQCFRTYSTDPIDHELLYRIESQNDESPFKAPPARPRRWGSSGSCVVLVGRSSASNSTLSSEPSKRKRCFSVHGLFSLTSVCRQIRADTHLLVYEHNAFAFTDGNYNYSSAISAFTKSLTEREVAAVHTIYWPLVNVLVYRHCLHGAQLEEPDRRCAKELGSLTKLEKVILRYWGNEFNIADKHSEAEANELRALLAPHGGWNYHVEKEYRRTLGVRAMKALLAREIEVQCEKSWRVCF